MKKRAEGRRATRRGRRLDLERIEPRLLLSLPPFVVNTTADDGPGSLRQAIDDSNHRASTPAQPNVIQFNIVGKSPLVIEPSKALPTITNPVILDATTQP